MEKMVSGNIEVMDKYDPEKKVGLVVDEWGGWYDTDPGADGSSLYQQNTMRDAMIAGLTLNIFNNHCDRVRMANLAQCVNVLQAVILTKEEKMILTPYLSCHGNVQCASECADATTYCFKQQLCFR